MESKMTDKEAAKLLGCPMEAIEFYKDLDILERMLHLTSRTYYINGTAEAIEHWRMEWEKHREWLAANPTPMDFIVKDLERAYKLVYDSNDGFNPDSRLDKAESLIKSVIKRLNPPPAP